MKNINIRKTYYHLSRYVTTNNAVIAAAVFVAFSWTIGSIGALEKNYTLQREIYDKQQQLKLIGVETQTLRYEQNYYKSDEYKELAVRKDLGLVRPGENVLILPPNTAAASANDVETAKSSSFVRPSNSKQWLDFLFGRSGQGLSQ